MFFTKDGRVVCEQCGATLVNEKCYMAHIKYQHDPEKSAPVACDVCSAVLSNTKRLADHKRRMHSNKREEILRKRRKPGGRHDQKQRKAEAMAQIALLKLAKETSSEPLPSATILSSPTIATPTAATTDTTAVGPSTTTTVRPTLAPLRFSPTVDTVDADPPSTTTATVTFPNTAVTDQSFSFYNPYENSSSNSTRLPPIINSISSKFSDKDSGFKPRLSPFLVSRRPVVFDVPSYYLVPSKQYWSEQDFVQHHQILKTLEPKVYNTMLYQRRQQK